MLATNTRQNREEITLSKKVDSLDIKIIESLTQDCRKSTTQIAKEAGTTRPTAIARINRLLKEQIIDCSAKMKPSSLGLKLASVHLVAEENQTSEHIVSTLKKCPRVVQLIQLTGQPNYTAIVVVEDAETLLSSLECMSKILKLKIVSYQRILPLIGNSFSVKVSSEKQDMTPCGKDCSVCLCYQQKECVGCPSSKKYKGPL